MANNLVRFVKGTKEQFAALTEKDSDTFYLVSDENDQDLYIGDENLTSKPITEDMIKNMLN